MSKRFFQAVLYDRSNLTEMLGKKVLIGNLPLMTQELNIAAFI
jgi:hypothetical protein